MTDFFDDTDPKPETTPESATPQSDPLDEIMGEGKKYKTSADVLRAIREKDAFIEKLKGENSGMRGDLATMEKKLDRQQTVEEVVQRLSETSDTEDHLGNHPQFGLDDVAKLVDERVPDIVAAAEQGRLRAANREKAKITLLGKFANDGTKAKEFFQTEASRLGLSTEQLTRISEDSPDAFARMLNLETKSPAPTPTPNLTTTVNTEGDLSAPTERNFAYYEKLRKDMGSKFYDVKIQSQMHKDALEQGESFYS